MPRSIWKGAISFGLVTIPIRVFTATEEKNISFRQVHATDGGRIKYKRICEVDGEEVPFPEIAKGYELPDGRMVILEASDFDALPLPTTKAVEVVQFVGQDEIDPTYFAKTYFLEADGPGTKPYVLLRDALVKPERCALVKVALRTRRTWRSSARATVCCVMHTMLWPDELRDGAVRGAAGDGDGVGRRGDDGAVVHRGARPVTSTRGVHRRLPGGAGGGGADQGRRGGGSPKRPRRPRRPRSSTWSASCAPRWRPPRSGRRRVRRRRPADPDRHPHPRPAPEGWAGSGGLVLGEPAGPRHSAACGTPRAPGRRGRLLQLAPGQQHVDLRHAGAEADGRPPPARRQVQGATQRHGLVCRRSSARASRSREPSAAASPHVVSSRIVSAAR